MPDDTTQARIAGIRASLEAAENAMDADAVARLLSDDAVLMVPDHPVQEGKLACVGFLRDLLAWLAAGFDRQVAYTSDEVSISGDIAFDRGRFAFTVAPKEGGGASRVTGKYLWILKRTGADDWLVTRLIASRDAEDDMDGRYQ